ncbi:hypothetical protein A2230_01155 [candidate division WOR-1 bacterium RIFOXYA2_FULL_36_21]|uniref:Uncharacterized protein n=1 Tax=candidate division WOR-1 bacterium RIFOXYB2_FULL_36_35 TaxID=1802578 RepID=A0A1F4RYR0_UNCSA|nr:MAG: hypothetical protein A2230_01155 [candidate division WOR-1 bacterium RIFOXYA2_FULL_36_21]OGC13326.1 MAG: hypothetical protein A2290_04645 [candidate division WOR-1 bacterium RIFOXYB2_FULL_36_35]OGC21033.1 MAG: hypothetical protein A2282_08410 [candidate division WOR-1 bacterium RIFOXYA12_FULL_36_13]
MEILLLSPVMAFGGCGNSESEQPSKKNKNQFPEPDCGSCVINPPVHPDNIEKLSDPSDPEATLNDEIEILEYLLSAEPQNNEAISKSAEKIAYLIAVIYCNYGSDKACDLFASLSETFGVWWVAGAEETGAKQAVLQKLVDQNMEIAADLLICLDNGSEVIASADLSPQEKAALISEIFKRDKKLAKDIFLEVKDPIFEVSTLFPQDLFASIQSNEILAYLSDRENYNDFEDWGENNFVYNSLGRLRFLSLVQYISRSYGEEKAVSLIRNLLFCNPEIQSSLQGDDILRNVERQVFVRNLFAEILERDNNQGTRLIKAFFKIDYDFSLSFFLTKETIMALNLSPDQIAEWIASAYDATGKGNEKTQNIKNFFRSPFLSREYSITEEEFKIKIFKALFEKYPKQTVELLTSGAINKNQISDALAEKLSKMINEKHAYLNDSQISSYLHPMDWILSNLFSSFILFLYDGLGQEEAGKALNSLCESQTSSNVLKMLELLFSIDRDKTTTLLINELNSDYSSYVAELFDKIFLSPYYYLAEGKLPDLLVALYDARKGDRAIAGKIFYNLKNDILKYIIASALLRNYPEYAAPILTLGEISKGYLTVDEIKKIERSHSFTWQDVVSSMILKVYDKADPYIKRIIFFRILENNLIGLADKWKILYKIARQGGEHSAADIISPNYYDTQILADVISFPFGKEGTTNERKAIIIILSELYAINLAPASCVIRRISDPAIVSTIILGIYGRMPSYGSNLLDIILSKKNQDILFEIMSNNISKAARLVTSTNSRSRLHIDLAGIIIDQVNLPEEDNKTKELAKLLVETIKIKANIDGSCNFAQDVFYYLCSSIPAHVTTSSESYSAYWNKMYDNLKKFFDIFQAEAKAQNVDVSWINMPNLLYLRDL